MSLPSTDLNAMAMSLDAAALNAQPVPMLTVERSLTTEQGYDVQRALVAQRLQRGAEIVGLKLGLTSKAKMEQVGVHEPIRGVLTSDMAIERESAFSASKCCHPRIEPEIAFIAGEPIAWPITLDEALSKISAVAVALEVIDSRYKDFKFALPDVVADNCSSCGFVLGPLHPIETVRHLDLGTLGVVLTHNGKVAHTASTAAVLGHPAHGLPALAKMLSREDQRIEAGHIVLTGGCTAAVHVAAGDVVSVEIEGLGQVSVSVSA